MPDEIDLLRLFRDDTPGPDDAAWEKARSAIEVINEPVAADHHDHRRPRRRRILVISAVAVVAGVAAGFLVSALQGPPSLARPLVTAWQPARPLPSAATGLRAPAGAWRLLSYLSPRGWQESTSGPEPGELTCPTALTCYVEGDSASSPSGPADMDSFYASADGARTWSVLPVPAGVTFTSALACATPDDCAAGGLYYNHQSVFLSTTTGGHSWTVSPLPAGTGQIVQLTCPSATSCRGLTQTSSVGPLPYVDQARPGIKLLTTTDGGRHVQVTPFPTGITILSLSCPTSAHCVAYGRPYSSHDKPGPERNTDVMLVTDDGGATWRSDRLPSHVGDGGIPEVTCMDVSHCVMLGYVFGPGSQGGSMSVSPSGKITETVPDQYSVVGFSADGGLTWTIRRPPASIPGLIVDALACPTASLCYAAGSAAIPQRIGNTYNGGSSIVIVTRDAGRTWQRVTFAVPARVPSGMQGDSFMDIGQIQCPLAGACVAMGVSDQGSTSTPIYTNHG